MTPASLDVELHSSRNPERWTEWTILTQSSTLDLYWQLYMMPSPPLIAVPGVQPMPLREA